MALISADALGFSDRILGPGRRFVGEVRERAAQAVEAEPEGVLLAATHAHSTPQTTDLAPLLDFPAAGPWLETLIEQLVSAVALAARDLQPATLRTATAPGPGIARNRRAHLSPRAPVDATLAVLLFEREDAPPAAVMHYACHPVTVQVQPQVSADFPGVATGLVEREYGCAVCLFLQGACGDINPLRNTSDFADVRRYGLALGGAALTALAHLSVLELEAEPSIDVAKTTVELTVRDLPPREPAEARAAALAAAWEAAEDDEERRGRARELRRARDVVRLLDLGIAPIHAPLTAVRMGDAAFLGVPGELFCRFGQEIRAASPFPVTLVMGYANDYLGYFIAPETFAEGGYEAMAGPWTRADGTAGERIAAAGADLLRRLGSMGDANP